MNEKPALYQIVRTGSILCFLFILLTTTAAVAANVTLRWDPNDPAPEGYRVFARRSDQVYNYSRPNWEGASATCNLNLEDQTEYFLVVRAYDGGLQSTNSNEVHYRPPAPTNPIPPTSTNNSQDTAAPSWNGATTGIGLAADAARGGRVTVEFDTARDGVDGANLRYNVYYAASGAWNNTRWTSNSVLADAALGAGSTFAHAVMVSGLTDGVSYTFGVRVEDRSGNEDTNTRRLTATPTVRSVESAYDLMVSRAPNRSGAVLLDSAGVEGNIYAFVEPVTDIRRVEFFIDGVLRKTENVAPYDLAGGTTGRANPFDADRLADGYHAFSARITKTNGSSEMISADVYVHEAGVVNTPPPVSNPTSAPSSSTYAQWVSTAPNRSQAEALDGATLGGLIYAFVAPTTDIRRVEFFIDGVLRKTENLAPYDLAGGAAGRADPFDADRLAVGNHTFSARITKTNGSSETITADVSVR